MSTMTRTIRDWSAAQCWASEMSDTASHDPSSQRKRDANELDGPWWDVEETHDAPPTIGLTPPVGDVDKRPSKSSRIEQRIEALTAGTIVGVLGAWLLPCTVFVLMIAAEWQLMRAALDRRHLGTRRWRRAAIGWCVAVVVGVTLLPVHMMCLEAFDVTKLSISVEGVMVIFASMSFSSAVLVLTIAAVAIVMTLARYASGESAWRLHRSLLRWSSVALLTALTAVVIQCLAVAVRPV